MNKSIYRLYIGANNETKHLELERLKTYLNSRISSYTLFLSKGLWEGVEEDSAVVEIAHTTSAEAKQIAKELCRLLQQSAVMVAKVATEAEFIRA